MSLSRSILLGVALAFAQAGVRAEALENAQLRLEVSAETGSIIRILDKRSGTEFVTDAGQAGLFQLMLPTIGERTRRILSRQQQATVEGTADGEIEIRYRQLQPDPEQYIFGSGLMSFPEAPLPIQATVRLRLDGDHLIARLALENRSHEPISSVIFPLLGGLAREQGGAHARIVLPSLGQRVFQNTLGAFSGARTNRYPGVLATSWLNYELAGQGLGLEARSSLAAQDAWFALNPGHFEPGSAYRGRYEHPFVAWISHPHMPTGSAWASPEMVIHVHPGDWHQVAAEHREWHRPESGPRTGMAWDESIGFATYRLKRDDNTAVWGYRDIGQLAEDAQQAGIKHLVIEGWREREGPANPAPFGEIADPRLGGAEVLRGVNSDLTARGVELMFAFHPVLLNIFADRYPSPQDAWLVRTSRDAAQIPVDFLMFTLDYPDRLDGGHYQAEIDPASAATDYLLQEALRLRSDYGIRSLLLKGVGQRAFLSYNRLHGVAPQDVYRVGYQRLLGSLREHYADGLLLNEGFNDLVNAFGDGAYTWDQSHDPAILPYSMPWRLLSNDVEALDYRMANASFAHKALINLIVDGGVGTVAPYPEFARHLCALQTLKAVTLPYYAQAEFRDREGLSEVVAPAGTVVSVFRNPDGRRMGVVMANLLDQAAQVSFALADRGHGETASLRRSGDAAVAAVALASEVAIELRPFEVAVLAVGE